MGYAIGFGGCLFCGHVFGFNPVYVPSMRKPCTGEKEPICRSCVQEINVIRLRAELEPFTIHPEAYEPLPENELRG